MTHREKALQWWGSLSIDMQIVFALVAVKGRHPSTLTGQEVEELYIDFHHRLDQLLSLS